MANPNDGTALGTAEIIADEYNDPTTGGRVNPNLPPTGYKMPRSKIIVGPYGQDGGDATADTPLQTESRAERLYLEQESLRSRERALASYAKSSAEYVSMIDARGHHFSTRGVR